MSGVTVRTVRTVRTCSCERSMGGPCPPPRAPVHDALPAANTALLMLPMWITRPLAFGNSESSGAARGGGGGLLGLSGRACSKLGKGGMCVARC